ncbi:MAG TPA: GH1 family beta-glucosidase [Ktedonobacteraceae bacterium]|nr:GH1 family beta-glucosidase [Ktedonobacteraceae bacterium]
MAQFPEHFRWGVATAAYQIEGAVREDGRGESIWDRFSHTPGKIKNGETGDIACDHYHLYPQDIQLMQELGLRNYRFSIAWPRILPNGRGQVNTAGLDFYERLVDALLSAGIEPFVTLYHWDLPQALQDEVGGWNSRETSHAFANYADVVSRRLGDRVKYWITLNEPWVSSFIGNEMGVHAPGLKDARTAWQVSHNLLLGHGLTVPILRANGNAETRVGITLVLTPVEAATDSPEDQQLALAADGKSNRWFLDPVFRGSYPQDVLDRLAQQHILPTIEAEDNAIIARPVDFLGLNYYYRTILHQKPDGSSEQIQPAGAEYTTMGWEVYPQGLHTLLSRLHNEYRVPAIYITENGTAFPDTLGPDGQVHDPRRLNYLREHFLQAQQAISEGVPLHGYFVWSLMDNFEWAAGYSQRFGIVYVDYPTQRRIIKDSGHWYSKVIAENAVL